MSAKIINIQEIREKHAWQIPAWGDSILELGKWMDDVEARLIREGKLKILKNGKYRWLNKDQKK